MYLRTFKICALKYMSLILDPGLISFSSWISMEAALKKTKVKLDVLTDIDMLKW